MEITDSKRDTKTVNSNKNLTVKALHSGSATFAVVLSLALYRGKATPPPRHVHTHHRQTDSYDNP